MNREDPLMEVVRINAPESLFAWEAVAIRLVADPEEPWHVFVSHADTERWLTPLETLDIPMELALVEPDEEWRLAKLIEVWGTEWENVLDDPTEVIGLQARALESMSSATVADLDATPHEEMAEWREEMQSVSIGEALYARLTGSDPRAVRN